VFRTYEPDRDRLVAVKVFRLDITPEQAQALADELSRSGQAGLFHPSIVEPIAAGVEGTVAYGAEEYVAAESLDVAMRHYAPAPIETVLPFITQLAGAIDFARVAGIGHGALHPRDIFMTPDEARATGFGVVEALERVGLRAPVRRPYSPPERIASESWGTPADVFSLAAITYELLTGRRPAGLGTEIGSLTAGNPNASMDALHMVLARGMQASPSARYTTALAFASALESAARGEVTQPITAVPLVVPATADPAVNPLTGAAAASTVPAAVSADRVPLEDDAEDDTLNEKEDDETHHQLSLREAEEADSDQPGLHLDEDIEAEAEADRFMFEVAGRAAKADVGQGARADGLDDLHRPPVPVYHPTFGHSEATVPPAREASPMWPLVAVVLGVGVLAGLGGGYLIWGRLTPASQSTAATSSPGTAPPTGREFSEQAVNPPAPTTRTPPAATPPAARSSAPDPSSTAVPPAAAGSGSSRPAAVAATPPVRATAGTIVVRSSPSGAGVLVNGRWRGRTPLTLEKLALRQYNVRVVQDGYAPATEAIALTAGAPSRSLSFQLQAQSRPSTGVAERRPASPPERSAPAAAAPRFTGSIYVDSRPRGARVSIDGREVGVTPLRVPEIRIGTRIVRLELPEYRIWSSTVRVAAGGEARVTGSLERIQ
jgi:serine/threonine-protein kinase